MSAAPAMALEESSRRVFHRHTINVPVDFIALRKGVPETLPGRCTDLSESGFGAVVAGELSPGQTLAIQLRFPTLNMPIRARAEVRYQSQLRCGFEFAGLSAEQREMIRYWIRHEKLRLINSKETRIVELATPLPAVSLQRAGNRRIRIGRRGFSFLIAGMLTFAGLGWWQWQRSWNELERASYEARELQIGSETRIPFEAMQKRLITKVDPVYPDGARTAGTEGLVVLDALIAQDGSVKRLRSESGPVSLVQSATEAVQSWKFEPYLSDGRPIEVETTIAVVFRLN